MIKKRRQLFKFYTTVFCKQKTKTFRFFVNKKYRKQSFRRAARALAHWRAQQPGADLLLILLKKLSTSFSFDLIYQIKDLIKVKVKASAIVFFKKRKVNILFSNYWKWRLSFFSRINKEEFLTFAFSFAKSRQKLCFWNKIFDLINQIKRGPARNKSILPLFLSYIMRSCMEGEYKVYFLKLICRRKSLIFYGCFFKNITIIFCFSGERGDGRLSRHVREREVHWKVGLLVSCITPVDIRSFFSRIKRGVKKCL